MSLIIITGNHGCGKSKLLKVCSSMLDENYVVLQATVGCDDVWLNTYRKKYNTLSIPDFMKDLSDYAYSWSVDEQETNREDMRFENDAATIKCALPSKTTIENEIQQGKYVILNVCGLLSEKSVKEIQSTFEGHKVVFIVVTGSKETYVERLKKYHLYEDIEIEKMSEFGQVRQEQLAKVDKIITLANDASIEEGARKLFGVLTTKRHHAEEVDQFYTARVKCLDYMKEKNIHQIVQYLTSKVLLDQPNDPKAYFIDQLKELKDDPNKLAEWMDEKAE